MLLSIGMIVKNEEKYLDRCLSALKPVLESIDSELIIADTGSEDSSYEIARKYTDNVFSFEWINDFSAARNSTLDKARGEWFMYIDGDEIFEDTSDLIRFFTSGEYKLYEAASFVMRNYSRENDFSEYSDQNAMRLFKITPTRRFYNRIHETFELTADKNVKDLTARAGHYGYLYASDDELRIRKGQRNLSLLMEELESGTDSFLIYNQIADCYSLLREYDKAEEYIRKGLDNSLSASDNTAVLYYAELMMYLDSFGKYSEAVGLYGEYAKRFGYRKGKAIATDCEMLYYYASALNKLKKIPEALEAYTDFFRLFKDLRNGKLNTIDLYYRVLNCRKPESVRKAMRDYAMLCIVSGKFGELNDLLRSMPLTDCSDRDYVNFRIDIQFEVSDHLGYKGLQSFYDRLDDMGRAEFIARARRGMMFAKKKQERADAMLSMKVSERELSESFGLYDRIMKNKAASEDIAGFKAAHDLREFPELLYMLLISDGDISEFVSEDFFDAKYFADNFARVPNIIGILRDHDISAVSPSGLEGAAVMYKTAMLGAVSSNTEHEHMAEKLIALGARWQSEFPDSPEMPAVVSESILIHNIRFEMSRKNYKGCIDELKKLIRFDRSYSVLVDHYRKAIETEMNAAKRQKNTILEMASIVKRNIRSMIEAGKLAEAETAASELEQLCPGDPDIALLKEKIEAAKQ